MENLKGRACEPGWKITRSAACLESSERQIGWMDRLYGCNCMYPTGEIWPIHGEGVHAGHIAPTPSMGTGDHVLKAYAYEAA